MGLLDNVEAIPTAVAAAAAAVGEALETDDIANPVTPEQTPDLLAAEPTEVAISRSPSQASERYHSHKVVLPSEVDSGPPIHRYRNSSDGGMSHGAADTSPRRSEPDVRHGSPEYRSSSEKADGEATPKGSLRSEPSSGHGTPRSRLRLEVGSSGGAGKGSPSRPLSETGTRQLTPQTGPRSEAPSVHSARKSGPPSETGTGQATPPTDPRPKAVSQTGYDVPKRGPPSEGGAGKASPQSSKADAGKLLHKAGLPSEVSLGAASSIATPIPGIWSATTGLPGPPLSQQTSAGIAWGAARVPMLPWSERALEDFKAEMKRTSFVLLDPADQPLTARLDAVFSMPPELWPVLPPGALYCLEASDPRVSFQYLQHRDFPTTKVRLGTYFGKWGRHLVDYAVAWQPTPRAEAAWQLADGKQPPLPWEPRQVVAHTTQGEYQYANTRMRFKGPKSTKPDAEVVEWSDAHGVDLLDTKAANETAARNSDKDRDAHLIDPPRPNTWGELARRPLIGSLRNRGGGTYMHHINYDHSGLRTTCGRRVPAGYFFTLVPNVPSKTPAVPGGPAKIRPSSVGRAIAAARQSRFHLPNNPSAASVAAAAASAVASAVSVLQRYGGAPPQGPSAEQSAAAGRPGGLAAQGSNLPSARPQRPSSAGARWASRQSSEGSAAAGSAVQRRSSGTGRSLLGGLAPATASPTNIGRSGGLQANASSMSYAAAVVGLDVVSLMPANRWRTYDVPFNHPLNSARAQDLGAEAAKASGRNVRSFSDAAAVMKVAEQELRLPRAFVPGPLVVATWDDIPRLYAEHMEAARALMPVTELDNYGSSKLHMLIHHLQCAATLEYDRLDAKLMLLPQMSRLGRKSAEIDAWLQALVEHASYLYDKLEICDSELWAPAFGEHSAALLRSSVAALPPQAALNAAAAATATAPGQSQGWVFPDPLRGTVHESRSAVNVAAQLRQSLTAQAVPAARVTPAEWSAITSIMDPTRHTALLEVWARLRPAMTGSAAPGGYHDGSRAGSMSVDFSSDAGATATGFGDMKPSASTLMGAAAPDPFGHGTVNREVLDYLPTDLAVMSSPDFVPPPPPPTKLPKHRGYRGEGPLPAELVADMPAVFKPVRCRGTDETPLPATYNSMDIWNMKTKAELASPRVGSRGVVPHPRDVGATRSSQVVVHRLQAAREFASSQQAAVRKSMQLAKGVKTFDDSDVPYYGSDVAEDELSSDIASSPAASSAPRRRPATATQTSDDLGKPTPEESALQEERSKAATEAAEVRKSLLRGPSSATREQVIDQALRAADAAIRTLNTRPPPSSGFRIPPPDLPDSPRLTLVREEPREAGMQPYTRGPPRIEHSSPEVLPFDWYLRPGGGAARTGGAGARPGSDWGQTSSLASPTGPEPGPEPFSLEKIWREPAGSTDVDFGVQAVPIAQLPVANFSEPNMGGYGGVVDCETAMSRRRAIAGAEVVHLEGSFISKSDLLNLLVVYCNLDRQPDQVELLQRTLEAPVSLRAVSAAAKAATAVAVAAGPASAAAAVAASAGKPGSARQEELETEGTRQRIRSTAWLLGVTWRRISNETYTSFLCRVMGWPAELADALHRTRATHIIARALVHGHDMKSVPKPPPRY